MNGPLAVLSANAPQPAVLSRPRRAHSYNDSARLTPIAGINCKQLLGLEDCANRLPKAVQRTAPLALIIYSLVIVWVHQTAHQSVLFPTRPWYRRKQEPSFADKLTTVRRVSYQEQTERPSSNRCPLKTVIAQFTEFLS